jgi:hypothetical protein
MPKLQKNNVKKRTRMKKVFILIFLLTPLLFQAQTNAIYILTEKWDGAGIPATYDSIFVTNPSGVTTSYSIPPLTSNPAGHDHHLSIIINDITSLGYRIISNENWSYPMYSNSFNPGFYIRAMFLGLP